MPGPFSAPITSSRRSSTRLAANVKHDRRLCPTGSRASRDVETIRLDRVLVRWIAGDLTHAIVKGGQRDEAIIDLSERFDYIDDTGDGRLESWT